MHHQVWGPVVQVPVVRAALSEREVVGSIRDHQRLFTSLAKAVFACLATDIKEDTITFSNIIHVDVLVVKTIVIGMETYLVFLDQRPAAVCRQQNNVFGKFTLFPTH